MKTTGDGVHAAFATADDAVARRSTAQRALGAEAWGCHGPLRVRMGLHTGAAEQRDGDYYGTAVNRAARSWRSPTAARSCARRRRRELARDALPTDVDAASISASTASATWPSRARVPGRRIRDLPRDFPPLRSLDAFPGNLPLQLTRVRRARATSSRRSPTLLARAPRGDAHRRRRRRQDPPGAPGRGRRCSPSFADGAWLCELAPRRAIRRASCEAVAAALGVSSAPGSPLDDKRWSTSSVTRSCCSCSTTASTSSTRRPSWST